MIPEQLQEDEVAMDHIEIYHLVDPQDQGFYFVITGPRSVVTQFLCHYGHPLRHIESGRWRKSYPFRSFELSYCTSRSALLPISGFQNNWAALWVDPGTSFTGYAWGKDSLVEGQARDKSQRFVADNISSQRLLS